MHIKQKFLEIQLANPRIHKYKSLPIVNNCEMCGNSFKYQITKLMVVRT